MEKWRKEAQITQELGLRPCSMNRCCNADRIQELQGFIERWYDTVIDLCQACDDTSYEVYKQEMDEIFGGNK